MYNDATEVVYQIDQNDFLLVVNDRWNKFATDNGSPHLVGEKIVALSLWDFIHDAETRHLHEVLLKKVRTEKAAIRKLPFRCDAPTLRRYMEMDVIPLPGGAIEYRCRTLRTEQREPVSLVTADERGSGRFVRMCSWCKKIDIEKNTWRDIEDAVNVLGLFSETNIPPISHTMCNACLERLMDDK